MVSSGVKKALFDWLVVQQQEHPAWDLVDLNHRNRILRWKKNPPLGIPLIPNWLFITGMTELA